MVEPAVFNLDFNLGYCQSCQLPLIVVEGKLVSPHPHDPTAVFELRLDGVTGLPTATWHKKDCPGDVQIRWDEVL